MCYDPNLASVTAITIDGKSDYITPLCDGNLLVIALDLDGTTSFLQEAWLHFDPKEIYTLHIVDRVIYRTMFSIIGVRGKGFILKVIHNF